jgi:hypothetical protein
MKRWLNKPLRRMKMIAVSGMFQVCFLAASQWPGGDDGPGMAWVYGIGLASLLSGVIGLPLVYT